MELEATMNQKSQHKLSNELSKLLADTYTLYLKTQNFHWNVTGELFPSLHSFFEKQYEELADAVDVLAEQIRALNAYAPGTFKQFQELMSLKEETTIPNAQKMIQILLNNHEHIIDYLPDMIEKAQKHGDEATADVFIERLRAHQKTAWMLRSSLAK
jgi:starvation-inducible DNA-binding protein